MEGKRIKFKLKDMSLWNYDWWEPRFGKDWFDKVYVGVLKDNLVTFTYKYQGIDETQPEHISDIIILNTVKRKCFKE